MFISLTDYEWRLTLCFTQVRVQKVNDF